MPAALSLSLQIQMPRKHLARKTQGRLGNDFEATRHRMEFPPICLEAYLRKTIDERRRKAHVVTNSEPGKLAAIRERISLHTWPNEWVQTITVHGVPMIWKQINPIPGDAQIVEHPNGRVPRKHDQHVDVAFGHSLSARDRAKQALRQNAAMAEFRLIGT